MTSVLIVDDHPVVREGLAGMLVSEKDFCIAGSCESGDEAERFCRKNGVCDVVLMDIRMPEQDGFETLERLKRFSPRIKVLLLAGMPMKPEAEKA